MCLPAKSVFFHRQKVKTWLGTEVPITVRGNNRVEGRHTSQNKKSPPGRHSGVGGCVCGGRGEFLVLSGCLFTAGAGSQSCKKMERRQTDKYLMISLSSVTSATSTLTLHSLSCIIWEKTSPWCEIDMPQGKMLVFFFFYTFGAGCYWPHGVVDWKGPVSRVKLSLWESN